MATIPDTRRAARRGTVTRFDDAHGWGTVSGADGGEHLFHCTALTDGSRTIAPGTAVRYRVVAGRLGRWEATAVEAEPATGSA